MTEEALKIKKQLQKCIMHYKTLKISSIEYKTKSINNYLSVIINTTLVEEDRILAKIAKLRQILDLYE